MTEQRPHPTRILVALEACLAVELQRNIAEHAEVSV
jgi:hypothetical protein